ncbi:MAG: hypothetical protein ACHQM6_10905 [Candidatus Kapaibacterium sp.]
MKRIILQPVITHYCDILEAETRNRIGKISGGNLLGILCVEANGKNVASNDIHSALESLLEDEVSLRFSQDPVNMDGHNYSAVASKKDKPVKWNIGELSRAEAEVRFNKLIEKAKADGNVLVRLSHSAMFAEWNGDGDRVSNMIPVTIKCLTPEKGLVDSVCSNY